MAIPVGLTVEQYYNQQINILVKTRDKFNNFFEDWGSLPVGVKNAIKARVNSDITAVKTALDDVNAAIQAL